MQIESTNILSENGKLGQTLILTTQAGQKRIVAYYFIY